MSESINISAEVVFDREQAFLIYTAFAGDVERTAASLNVRPVDVLKIADECKWLERLKPILELKKSQRPGDLERAINRALNFVQAHRLRLIIERVISKLAAMGESELNDYIFSAAGEEGETYRKLTTRALADLASAVEKCHSMSYAALSDSVKERQKREESGAESEGGDLHAQIAKAMSEVSGDKSARAMLFDAQIESAQAIALAGEVKASQYDKD